MTITWEEFINNHKPDINGIKIHCKDNDRHYESRNGRWVEVQKELTPEEKLTRIVNPKSVGDYGLSLNEQELMKLGVISADSYNDIVTESILSNIKNTQEKILFNVLNNDTESKQNIEQCFEEIKQVLKKYECEIYTCDDGEINICSANGVDKYYLSEDFNK